MAAPIGGIDIQSLFLAVTVLCNIIHHMTSQNVDWLLLDSAEILLQSTESWTLPVYTMHRLAVGRGLPQARAISALRRETLASRSVMREPLATRSGLEGVNPLHNLRGVHLRRPRRRPAGDLVAEP
jgi:hypothetical protein